VSQQQSSSVGKQQSPVTQLSSYLDKFKPQLALALPTHMKADRLARLALSEFSKNPSLQGCTYQSIAASIMIAGQLGLEIGVNGQGYLVPYKTTCTFVPGWKGLQDLANRSGRATTWTGAVFTGDTFDYQLGDRPFVHHRPGIEDHPDKLTHVYAIGRVNGSDWPIIEVWPIEKVRRHRDKFNKVGTKHYSFRDWEMYARKVPLLQVLKYVPSSIELANAIAVANAGESGQRATIEGDFVTVTDDLDGTDGGAPSGPPAAAEQRTVTPVCSEDEFAKKSGEWRGIILSKKKSVSDLIATIQTKTMLTDAQKSTIDAWSHEND
jgi:recombination protein RecT